MRNTPIQRVEDSAVESRRSGYLDLVTASFVAVLILSNIGSTKIVEAGPFQFDGGTVLFPLSYVFGDILTEVYGYRRSRRVIWTGFVWIIISAAFLTVLDGLRAAPGYELSEAFHLILGQAPRIIVASLVAFWAGEFVNSYVMARLKVATDGRRLWSRTISSTLIGQAVDTVLFLSIAFIGVLPGDLLIAVFISNYVFKVGIEVLLTPMTYLIVNWLKRAEGVDVFDVRTDFNPFHWSRAR